MADVYLCESCGDELSLSEVVVAAARIQTLRCFGGVRTVATAGTFFHPGHWLAADPGYRRVAEMTLAAALALSDAAWRDPAE